jgi:hypothetical protein
MPDRAGLFRADAQHGLRNLYQLRAEYFPAGKCPALMICGYSVRETGSIFAECALVTPKTGTILAA